MVSRGALGMVEVMAAVGMVVVVAMAWEDLVVEKAIWSQVMAAWEKMMAVVAKEVGRADGGAVVGVAPVAGYRIRIHHNPMVSFLLCTS